MIYSRLKRSTHSQYYESNKEESHMKQTTEFAVKTQGNQIQKVGKSVIEHPPIKFDDSKGGTKWFDDSRLLKRK